MAANQFSLAVSGPYRGFRANTLRTSTLSSPTFQLHLQGLAFISQMDLERCHSSPMLHALVVSAGRV